MRAINHAMTGALIGLISGEPLVAVPAAVVSHFVMDAIPHHGGSQSDDQTIRSRWFNLMLVTDAVLCAALVVVLASKQPLNWQLAAVCAFLAAAPDFLSFNRYIKTIRRKPVRLSHFVQWTRDIQWFERPIGAVVEIAWFAAALVLLSVYIY